MSLETAVQGAKYQSFRSASPRHLLKRIYDSNPFASEDELQRLYSDEIRRDENREYLDSAIEYSFRGAYRALVGNPPRSAHDFSPELKEKIAARVKEEAQVILLDLMMPNGKRLAECTAIDCRKAGGFYERLASIIPDGKTVGEVLSESQVRTICNANV